VVAFAEPDIASELTITHIGLLGTSQGEHDAFRRLLPIPYTSQLGEGNRVCLDLKFAGDNCAHDPADRFEEAFV
jgi:hypothetical protein